MNPDTAFPRMNPVEYRDLERLAGRKFLRLADAYAFLRRLVTEESLNDLMGVARGANRRRSRRVA